MIFHLIIFSYYSQYDDLLIYNYSYSLPHNKYYYSYVNNSCIYYYYVDMSLYVNSIHFNTWIVSNYLVISNISSNWEYVFDDIPTATYDIMLLKLVVTSIINNNGVLYCLVHVLFNARLLEEKFIL